MWLLSRELVTMLSFEPVNRFMTESVLAIDVESPASEVLRMFRAYPVHHLPVVDGNKVVGMLSSADVLKLQAFLPKSAARPAEFLDRSVKIAQLMRSPVVSVQPHQSVEHAASLMAENGVHALPVTDNLDNLLGIISTTDIMYAVLHPERRGDGSDGAPAPGTTDLQAMRTRLRQLEEVLNAADRYLHGGQSEQLHVELLSAVARARGYQTPAPLLAAG